MVHRYTNLASPVEVGSGTVVQRATPSSLRRTCDDKVAMGLPVEQQSHRGLQQAMPILYNGVQLTPYLRVFACVVCCDSCWNIGIFSTENFSSMLESEYIPELWILKVVFPCLISQKKITRSLLLGKAVNNVLLVQVTTASCLCRRKFLKKMKHTSPLKS